MNSNDKLAESMRALADAWWQSDSPIAQVHAALLDGALAAAPAPSEPAEAVGTLTVRRYRGSDAMVNHDFDLHATLPDGSYQLYLRQTEPAPATSEPDEAVGIVHNGNLVWKIDAHAPDGSLLYVRPQTEPAPNHIPGVGEMVEPAPAVGEVAAAWMHDDPNRVDVIHAKVKDLLIQSRDSAGHLHRPLDKAEHYTVPLYTRPQGDALKQLANRAVPFLMDKEID